MNLEKVFKQPQLMNTLGKLSSTLKLDFCIQAMDGRVLFGNAQNDGSNRHALLYFMQQYAWLSGGDVNQTCAELVEYLINNEYEKRLLIQETLEKYKEITLLYDITEIVTASLDIEKVSAIVIEKVKKQIEGDQGSIMLLNEITQEYEVIAAFGPVYSPKTVIKAGQGIVGAVIQSGKGEIVNNAEEDPRYVKGYNKISAMICAPLNTKQKVIGAINISSKDPYQYTADQLKLLMTIATEVAVAIENARLYSRLKEVFVRTVYTLADTIEKRDPYTGGHTKRVMEYSLAIGEALDLSRDMIDTLKITAILHDIGKIGVRDGVLLKQGKLSADEFVEMKRHPVMGAEIIGNIDDFRDFIPGIKHHHERYDGAGYPEHLAGENIHIIARIISVADTFDAMTSDRPYRKALSLDKAFDELINNSGTQFDPQIVEAFIRIYHEKNLGRIRLEDASMNDTNIKI